MIRLYLIAATLIISVASCSKKFIQEEQVVESYYLIHTFNSNSIDTSKIKGLHYLSFKKAKDRYIEVMVKPEKMDYIIRWSVRNDSIYLDESTVSSSFRTAWKYTKSNYISTLNRIELFQSLPFNPYFAKVENQYDYAKKDTTYKHFYSNVESGITYKRQNIKSGIIDSLSRISRTDIVQYVSYNIMSSSFDSLCFNSDLLVPFIPKQANSLRFNEIDSLLFQLKGPKKYLLIDFGYVYCYPCRISWHELEKFDEFSDLLNIYVLNPIDEKDLMLKVAKQYSSLISFVQCDMAVVNHFQVKSYPTVLLFDDKYKLILRSDQFVDRSKFYNAVKVKIGSLE